MEAQEEILQLLQHCCLRLHMTIIQFGCAMFNLQKVDFSTITDEYRLPFVLIKQISVNILRVSNTTLEPLLFFCLELSEKWSAVSVQ